MRGLVPPDPETRVSAERYAVIYMPSKSRNRFPSGCVTVVETAEEAMEQADEASKCYPAKVIGPSKSSEGQYIYYLVEWL